MDKHGRTRVVRRRKPVAVVKLFKTPGGTDLKQHRDGIHLDAGVENRL
jgi:hypothetical protein